MNFNFKTDGSQWYNYFQIRLNDCGHYYFAWIGTKRNAFPGDEWRAVENMKAWILNQNWRKKVDEEFEREVLGEKE